MGRNKLPHRFGSIPQRIWEQIENKKKQFLHKYDYFIRQTYKIDDEILELQQEIKELKKKKEYYRKRCEQIWVEHRHLKEDYSISFNVTAYHKYTRVKSKNKGFNKVGKSISQLREEKKLIGKYWSINVKYKGLTKSIYIGSDNYIKDYLKNDEWVNENKEFLEIEDIDNLTEDNIKLSVRKLINDNLEDVVLSPDNFFNSKPKFTELAS